MANTLTRRQLRNGCTASLNELRVKRAADASMTKKTGQSKRRNSRKPPRSQGLLDIVIHIEASGACPRQVLLRGVLLSLTRHKARGYARDVVNARPVIGAGCEAGLSLNWVPTVLSGEGGIVKNDRSQIVNNSWVHFRVSCE